MTNTITYCDDHPIKTDIADWMNEHIGRTSVGRDKEDYYEILAYSDQESDRPELQRMAKREKAVYIKSILSEGVTTVD